MRRTNLAFSACFVLLLLSASAGAADTPTEHDFTASDGVKIHYYEMGQGVPVIFVHGYTSNADRNWIKNGIMPAVAKNHRVIAIDCRNHGKSDKPTPGGMGEAKDVVELMNHLKIQKAHVHGYSMGGMITQRLLTMIPDRMISAGFGGSGPTEVDPEWRAKVPADKTGRDPDEDKIQREMRIIRAMDNGMSRADAEKQADAQPATPATGAPAGAARGAAGAGGAAAGAARAGAGAAAASTGPALDLTKLNIPMLVINGEFDRPNAKSTRVAREVKDHVILVLPGRSHNSAISSLTMPKEYLETTVKFINDHDPK